MITTSPDLIQKVEAESVANDKALGDLMAAWWHAPTVDESLAAQAAIVSCIDSIITARVAAARQEGRRDTHEEKIQLMLENSKLVATLGTLAASHRTLAASQAAPAKAEGWDAALLAAARAITPSTPAKEPTL